MSVRTIPPNITTGSIESYIINANKRSSTLLLGCNDSINMKQIKPENQVKRNTSPSFFGFSTDLTLKAVFHVIQEQP